MKIFAFFAFCLLFDLAFCSPINKKDEVEGESENIFERVKDAGAESGAHVYKEVTEAVGQTMEAVRGALTNLWETKSETAGNTRSYLSQVFSQVSKEARMFRDSIVKMNKDDDEGTVTTRERSGKTFSTILCVFSKFTAEGCDDDDDGDDETDPEGEGEVSTTTTTTTTTAASVEEEEEEGSRQAAVEVSPRTIDQDDIVPDDEVDIKAVQYVSGQLEQLSQALKDQAVNLDTSDPRSSDAIVRFSDSLDLMVRRLRDDLRRE